MPGKNIRWRCYKNTSFFKKLQEGTLHLPANNVLPNTDLSLPFVFVADDAFPLHNHILKPYPGVNEKGSIERIYNYRLSRARRIVENVFGIMTAVFRVLRKPSLLEPQKVQKVVLACVHLHNYLRKSKSSRYIYTHQGSLDSEVKGVLANGSWRQDSGTTSSLIPIRKVARKTSSVTKENRQQFAEYFATAGRVPWQDFYA